MCKLRLQKAVSAFLFLLAASCALQASPEISWASPSADIRDGDLVRFDVRNSDGTPALESLDVYIIKLVGEKKAFKRVILNPWIFNSYSHFHWNDVKTLPAARKNDYRTSSLVRVDGHDEIYVLAPNPHSDSGRKSWVNLTENEFRYVGEDPDSVYTINQSDFSCYSEVESMRSVEDLRAFNALGVLPETVELSVLTVSPVADAGGNIIKKGVSSPFLSFKMSAEYYDVRIKSVTFTVGKTGSADCSSVKDIQVYDSQGVLVNATPVSAASNCKAKINFNAYRVTKDTAVTFTVKAKVDTPQQYLNLGIATVLDIDSDAESNPMVDSQGSIGWETSPIVGNLKQIIP